MQIEVHGKNLPVTDPLRQYAQKKLERLSRFFSPECRVDVELAVERNPRIAASQIAEATITTRGEVLRARATDPDMYAAVDGLIDRLRRQAVTYHDRRAPGRRPHGGKATAPADGAGEVEVTSLDLERDELEGLSREGRATG